MLLITWRLFFTPVVDLPDELLFLVEEPPKAFLGATAHLDFGAQGLVRLGELGGARLDAPLKAVVRVAQAPRELRDLEVLRRPAP